MAPLPTPSQFRWHQQELQVLIHYYINQVNELFDRYGKIVSFWQNLAFKDEGYSMPFAYTGGIQPEAENVGKHPSYKAI